MSHELRTPLNSILILGQQLAENVGGNLTAKQIDFAKNIHSAGTDLLTLINDILDLSKIESGTVTVEPEEITFASLRDTRRTARSTTSPRPRTSRFNVEIDPALPRSFTSDPKRLQQILKNLLSNAFKFTAQGQVVDERPAGDVRLVARPSGAAARQHGVAFAVTDTGIGIAPEKQRLIFEAFQQADAGTSRKYGGTGLGLAISRELANLLGGEIRLVEQAGTGQHVHALPAARLHRPGGASRRPARRRSASAAGAGDPAGARRRQARGDRPRRPRRHSRGRHACC